MRFSRKVISFFSKTKIGGAFIKKRSSRIIFSASVSFFVNFLYAFYNGILGIMNLSLWFIIMFAFYGLLASVRFSVILYARRKDSVYEDTESFIIKTSGIIMIILSFVLALLVFLSLTQKIAVKYDTIMMITIATYTFYKVIITVVRASKKRDDKLPLFSTLRCISYAEVAASVLTLQRSMLASFGSGDDEFSFIMNAATGMVVFLFILALGIFITVKGSRKNIKIKKENIDKNLR